MKIELTALIIGFVLFALIIELLRRKALREKYAVVWLGAGILVVLGALFPTFVNQISTALGFNVLSNFLLAGSGLVLLVVVMHMSLEIGTLEDKVQTLAEQSALLKMKLDELENDDQS